uniref:MICAL-like protein 1 isoform X2 n=1 Tax=Myxine glutinosa TaxID=7769 RepID=UPI00358EF32A
MAGGAAVIKKLQAWCKRQVEDYPNVSVTNMTTSFRDGLAFCAIIHHFHPNLIGYHSLSKENVFENNNLAFTVAEQELGIPALLDAEDMVAMKVPDRLSIVTYVSLYHNFFTKRSPLGGAQKRPCERSEIEPTPKKAVMVEEKGRKEKNSKHEISSPGTVAATCALCGEHVHLVQRHLVDGHLYHRNCFRCKECNNTLIRGAYSTGKDTGTFVCQHHKARQSSALQPTNIQPSAYNAQTGQKPLNTRCLITTSSSSPSTRPIACVAYTPAKTSFFVVKPSTTSSQSMQVYEPKQEKPASVMSSKVQGSTYQPTHSTEIAAARKAFLNAETRPTSHRGKDGISLSQKPSAVSTAQYSSSQITSPSSVMVSPRHITQVTIAIPSEPQMSTPSSGTKAARDKARIFLGNKLGKLSMAGTSSSSSGEKPQTSTVFSEFSNKGLNLSSHTKRTSLTNSNEPMPSPIYSVPTCMPSYSFSSSSSSLANSFSPSLNFSHSSSTSSFAGKSNSTATPQSTISSFSAIPKTSQNAHDSAFGTRGLNAVGKSTSSEGSQPHKRSVDSSSKETGASYWGVHLRTVGSPEGKSTDLHTKSQTMATSGPSPSSPVYSTSNVNPAVKQGQRDKYKPNTITSPAPGTSPAKNYSPSNRPNHPPPPRESPTGPAAKAQSNCTKPGATTYKNALQVYRKKTNAPGYGFPHTQRKAHGVDYTSSYDIQLRLSIISIHLDELEAKGVILEKNLRSCEGEEREDKLLADWFRLINEKNQLVRQESELNHIIHQQILEKQHANVESELRRLYCKPELDCTVEDKARQEELLNELVHIVEARNAIVNHLDEDRIREKEEDEILDEILRQKGIFKSPEMEREEKNNNNNMQITKEEKQGNDDGEKNDEKNAVKEKTPTGQKSKKKKKKKKKKGTLICTR